MSSFANIGNRDQLGARLDEPDILVGARVDRQSAVYEETHRFVARKAPAWKQHLPSYLPEIRHYCDKFMAEYRQVFASRNVDMPGDMPPSAQRVAISRDSRMTIGNVIAPTHVPIALWRNGYEFVRQYCWGHSDSSLDAAYETVRRLTRPRAEHDLENSGGCDFGFIAPQYHRPLSQVPADEDFAGMRVPLSVWLFERGEYVLMMKICTACIGAMYEKYQIGKSEILHPWEQPIIG